MRAFAPTFGLQRLQHPPNSDFDELVAIYAEAFPNEERKPVEVLLRMLVDAQNYFFLARTEGQIAGMAILRRLGSGEAALLEYMAVRPNLRGGGYGRRMFAAIAHAMNVPPGTLLMELESDRVVGPEQELRSRRKRFYRSLGAKEVSQLTWFMPPVIAAMPPPMEILVFGDPRSVVPKSEVRNWLVSIYVEVYGQSSTDARIAKMLAGLPGMIALV